jgi:hypothetical protein
MRLCAAVVVAAVGCGDDRQGIDASIVVLDTPAEATVQGDLFGEECTQPPFPQVGICRDGQGACNDEASGSRCRPFCTRDGVPQCMARQGIEVVTDRGACVCVPP